MSVLLLITGLRETGGLGTLPLATRLGKLNDELVAGEMRPGRIFILCVCVCVCVVHNYECEWYSDIFASLFYVLQTTLTSI